MRERSEAIRRFTGPMRVAEFRSNREAAPPSGGSDDAHLTHRHELQHPSLRRSAPDSRHEIREWTHVRCSGSGALLRQNWLFLQTTAPCRIRKCDSTKRIPPGLRNASRVLDFLGPEKFCQMIDRLPDLPRDLLVARCTRLCMDRIDQELSVLPVHLGVNVADKPVCP